MGTYSEALAARLAAYNLPFTAGSTGGGCMALILTAPDGSEFTVTNGDADLPDAEGVTLIHRTDKGGDVVLWEADGVDVAGASWVIARKVLPLL